MAKSPRGAAAKLKKKEFLAELGQLADALRVQIEAEVDGFNPDPSQIAVRREAQRKDFRKFCQTYFPHYVKKGESVLHAYLYERAPAIIANPRSQSDAIAAPRGEAKSTIVSQLFVLWCIVNGYKHYAIIAMDAFEQAAVMLEAIKAELESNPRLALDFPEATGQGRVWQAAVILTANNIKVEVFGSGKRIRGRRHGPHRPDLFIGDDLENDDNVRSPEQRDKLMSWLTKSVMKLGAAGEKFDAIIIGTVLHYDSVLSRLLNNKLWRARRFKALIKNPDRMDLWDQWEEILLNQGEDEAEDFYLVRKAEMDEGAIVSWPDGRPLYALMFIRARDGHAAFDSELQNDPLSGDDAPFAQSIHFWVNRLNEWVFYGACDPSLGKAGNSRDPSAILVGGFLRATGVLDVVEAAIRKRVPDRIISDIIDMQREYRCLLWGIEAVQFQEFLRTELVKRSAEMGVPCPARPVIPNADKLLRIEALQPHMFNKLIRLHPGQSTLIDQLRHFPKADHDDGPDALEILWKLATLGFVTGGGIRGTGNRGGGRRTAINDYVGSMQ